MSLVTPHPVRVTSFRLTAHLQTVPVVLSLYILPGNVHCCHSGNNVCKSHLSHAVDGRNTSSSSPGLVVESSVVVGQTGELAYILGAGSVSADLETVVSSLVTVEGCSGTGVWGNILGQ